MEKAVLNNGIKKIAIENEDGEVVSTLRIDVNDSRVIERFANLIDNLNSLTDEFQKETAVLDEKYKDTEDDSENPDIDKAVDYSKAATGYLQQCADEIDAVFGAGTIKAVFKENYELHPDYVPDEYALLQFVEAVTPVMEELFQTRFDENRKKYSATKRGRKSK